MESVDTINKLLHAAYCAGLDGTDDAVAFGFVRLQEAYNGIGPESLQPELRDRVTRYLSLFAPAALIHDFRYDQSDGMRAAWMFANYEFFVNCFKLARDRYPWWNPRRYFAQEAAWLLYYAVESSSGWQSWQEAYAKREEREKISGNDAGETNKEKTK